VSIILDEAYTKAMKVFIQKAMQWGAKLVPSKGKHLKFRDSLGHQISAPKTSSDWRSIKNFESELRRKGFVNQNTATKVKDALPSTTKPKVKEIKLSSQQRRLSASANRKAGGLSLQNFMRKVEGKDLIQPTPTSRTTIKSLPASKLGKPAPKVPTLTQRKLKPSTAPRTGSNPSERMTKAFDDKLDALIQSVRNSPRRRVNRLEKSSTTRSTSTRTPKGERKKISRAELDGMNIPQKQKDELIKQGLVTENKFRAAAQLMRKAGVRNYDDLVRTVSELKNKASGIKKPLKPGVRRQLMKKVQEQMVVPRSIKKKNPLMTVKTEMEILKQLSNRKAAYDAARTGKAMYPFSEDNKHRDAKLNYQYKEVTNPKRPVDVIKALKLKKV
jgi:hypothetical protein